MNLPRRREIVGTQVSITDYAEVLDSFDAAIAGDERIFVCCAPASTLMFARRDERLQQALAAAQIVTPDGMGVVYAARLLGESIGDRVYGPDLMLAQLERAAAAGTPTFLVGGHDQAALDLLQETLIDRFPGLSIVGGVSPPHREPTPDERTATIDAINASGAQIVWVGLGSPKQELWMMDHRDALAAPVLCGVGAAFDFLIGRVEQAPRWMQSRGLEWLYRVFKEPRRLGHRYLITLPAFAAGVVSQRLRGASAE
ncbi:MAG: WecB/TagA/CpsF family glycosyltransferase [Thermoleophilaceae bacterium]|nr:WecB/TagA/CpsF family glycosyltransferase [Thermoleophilaceae bacterium]